jgi:hypothetical protein
MSRRACDAVKPLSSATSLRSDARRTSLTLPFGRLGTFGELLRFGLAGLLDLGESVGGGLVVLGAPLPLSSLGLPVDLGLLLLLGLLCRGFGLVFGRRFTHGVVSRAG